MNIRTAFTAVSVGIVLLLAEAKAAQALDIAQITTLAEAGNADAQCSLGFMYDQGTGVPKNHAEAIKWYRLSAAQGYRQAQFFLGRIYDEGDGVPENDEEAMKWYRLAADQGHPGAYIGLALMYSDGDRSPEDNIQAYKWWSLAATRGAKEAKKNLSRLAVMMTEEQLTEAQRLSAEWKVK
jgi:uncharacterized protein